MIWPRSAILHSAAASMVDGTFGLTVSIADRIATRTSALPSACARSIAFWTMWTLSSSVGAMLTAASVTISGSVVGGHVHDEAVADAPRGAQPGLARDHRGHQFVGVQAALHQASALPSRTSRTASGGGGLAVGRVDDLEAGDVDVACFATPRCARRPDQDRRDQPRPRGIDGAGERGLVAGMRDRGGSAGRVLAELEQALVVLVLRAHRFALAPERAGMPARAPCVGLRTGQRSPMCSSIAELLGRGLRCCTRWSASRRSSSVEQPLAVRRFGSSCGSVASAARARSAR